MRSWSSASSTDATDTAGADKSKVLMVTVKRNSPNRTSHER